MAVLFWPEGSLAPSAEAPQPVAEFTDSYRRIQAKSAVVCELIADRVSLADGVRRCLESERSFPELADVTRRNIEAVFPGDTYEEKLAHNLVVMSQCVLMYDAGRATAVRDRLNAELSATWPSH
jgi:hypothetical protein